MDQMWTIPDWVVLWGERLYNPASLAVLRLDDEAARTVRELVSRGVFDFADAAGLGVDQAAWGELERGGFVVPVTAANRACLREAVEARRNRQAAHAAGARIGSLRLVLTQACNLRCDYCFVPADAPPQRMTVDIALTAVERFVQAAEGHLEQLQFFGGEPLLCIDLIEAVVACIARKGAEGLVRSVGYALTTNGTLITPPMADFLARHRFNVDVSLDGLPAVHNAHRRMRSGAASFDAALRGIRLLQERGLDVGVIITPTAESLAALPAFTRYLIGELGCQSIAINTPQPDARGWPVDGRFFAQQAIAAMQMAQAAGVRFSSAIGRVQAAIRGGRPYDYPCLRGTGTLGVSVSPAGLVSPCDVAWHADIAVGDVSDLGPRLPLAQWKLLPHRVPDECLACFALPACGGPCPLDLYGNPDDARTNVQRCDFFREVTRWAVTQLT